MRVPLYDQAAQLAKLSLKKRLSDDGISIYGLLVQPDELLKACIDPLLQSDDLFLPHKLALVDLEIGLHCRDFVLGEAQLFDQVRVAAQLFLVGGELLRLLELLFMVALLRELDFLDLGLQHFGLLHARLSIFALPEQLLDQRLREVLRFRAAIDGQGNLCDGDLADFEVVVKVPNGLCHA